MTIRHFPLYLLCIAAFFTGCAGPTPGPDKQFAGALEGAASSAGAGAVYGIQVGAGNPAGALVGAGIGAVAGSISGFGQDQAEENLLALNEATRRQREKSIAQQIIAENYKRRLEMHPTRDIYPADLFFSSDDVRLSQLGMIIMRELADLNQNRLPWSRFVVAAYVRSNDKDSAFAHYLAEQRAMQIGDFLVRSGFDPRRIVARAVVIDSPVLLDPHDTPERYNQAIEFIPADR